MHGFRGAASEGWRVTAGSDSVAFLREDASNWPKGPSPPVGGKADQERHAADHGNHKQGLRNLLSGPAYRIFGDLGFGILRRRFCPLRRHQKTMGVDSVWSAGDKGEQVLARLGMEVSCSGLRDINRGRSDPVGQGLPQDVNINQVALFDFGQRVKPEGIIDRVGTLSDALEALYGQIGRRRR